MAKNESTEKQDFLDYADKLSLWADKNAKKIVVAFLAIAVILVGFWSVSAVKNRQIQKATQAAGLNNRKIDLLEKAIANTKDKEAQKFLENKNAEVEKVNSSIDELIKNFPQATATDYTVVRWAGFLSSEDLKEKALYFINKLQPSSSKPLSANVLILKGSLLVDLDKNEEALKVYDEVINTKAWDIFHTEAYINKALILKKDGKIEEATEILNHAKKEAKDSSAEGDIDKYLRLIKLNKNHTLNEEVNIKNTEG